MACSRCASPSSGCGPCSRPPSCSTICSGHGRVAPRCPQCLRRGRGGRPVRPRSDDVDDVRWTASDVALLDDAREVLGPVPTRNGRIDDAEEIRTFGHIVVDEVQDLSPMQLRMVARRSLNGSLTVVGDLAQATGPWGSVELERRHRFPPGPPTRSSVGAVGRLPHPRPDHGAGRPGDHAATPGLAFAPIGARGRCVARGGGRFVGCRARRRRRRSNVGVDGGA